MKRGVTEHPKFKRLARALELPPYAAVGVLESLWMFTGKFARQGDVGRFCDDDIADGIGWNRETEKLVNALIETGWVDKHPEYRLIVHDWHDHADNSTKTALRRAGQDFVTRLQPVTTDLKPVTTDCGPSASVSVSVSVPPPTRDVSQQVKKKPRKKQSPVLNGQDAVALWFDAHRETLGSDPPLLAADKKLLKQLAASDGITPEEFKGAILAFFAISAADDRFVAKGGRSPKVFRERFAACVETARNQAEIARRQQPEIELTEADHAAFEETGQ